MDFHAWVEIDGKVIDWDMTSKYLKNNLEYISYFHHKTRDFEPTYVEWTTITKPHQDVIDKYVKTMEKLAEVNNQKELWKYFKNKKNYCLQRAIILKNRNPKAVIKYGSLGLKNKNGNVWYEFGNGCNNSKDKAKHIGF
tara:strand:+ start:151 stop:567 length:417 start_codon:yes stop_codon:yes gene_type:complete